MNVKKTIKALNKYSNNVSEIERMIVYAFIKKENIEYNYSDIIKDYVSQLNGMLRDKAIDFFSKDEEMLSFDFIVELFEQIVPEIEKKERGIVYTPRKIKEYIISQVVKSNKVPSIIDPSCGCGGFLVTAAQYIHKQFNKSYCDIISQNIFGIDIDNSAIAKAKLLLELLASANGEYGEKTFNFQCANALDPNTVSKALKWQPNGFDCVIGNPPYVRFRNMSDESRTLLKHWPSGDTGNVDLYMPFFDMGVTLLKKGAVLSYITPNSYIQAVNGRKLRMFLAAKNHSIAIVDFRDAQIFKNVTSYTCITTVDSSTISNVIKYVRINENQTLECHSYSEYYTSVFSNGAPWRMRNNAIDSIIKKLESTGTPLSKWKIRNGLATLKNAIYFFTPSKSDDEYYYRIFNGVEYRIERSICIKVAKPNIIKNEQDLIDKIEIAIFPYKLKENVFVIIDEDEMEAKYPYAYNFFLDNKEVLQQRDKGKANYPTWYAYGRTQGMNNFGKKLLIPYIAGEPIAVLSLEENLLFYCGYALISDNEQELRVLKCFLESDAFWYYIYHTSKPYSKGYMAFAKNYIINFSIPNISKEEVKYLLSSPPKEELNKWIWSKYGIDEAILESKTISNSKL